LPKDVVSQVAVNLSRFCLGVINGESQIESPIHQANLMYLFQAIFDSVLYCTNITERSGLKIVLSQAVQTITKRFAEPPIYTSEVDLYSYILARKIIFNCFSDNIFELIDNSSICPLQSSIYEADALLLLRTLCNLSLLVNDSPENVITLDTAQLSLDMVSVLISVDTQRIISSTKYLQYIKTFICSLIIRHSNSSSFPVFSSTVSLCCRLMYQYRDILKPESSVFFSTILLRTLDNNTKNPFVICVIDCIKKFHPEFLAEIFVNFDCDIDLQEADVFVHIINSLISKSNISDSVLCLSSILRSLNEWSKEHISETPSPFEATRKLKQLYSRAIDEFNSDPVHNIDSLINSGLVQDNPKSIASFFHSHRHLLNSSGIGLILGSDPKSKPLFKSIMHEFVDQIDFSSMSLCEAIYHFLSLFRLPPESQQIDRILEKFAHAYYVSHSSQFPSASIVYDVSFAAVFLHTDAHNPRVKEKMTKAQFLKMYRDMDEGDAVSSDFLSEIYDYVVLHEISLLGETIISNDFKSPSQKGAESFKQSMKHIQEAQTRMKSSSFGIIRWVSPVAPDTVRPMFDAIWSQLHALASKILNDGGEEEKIYSAVILLTSSISIAARFYMETESTVCMSALCTFTRLQPWSPIQLQNIRAIRELLQMTKSFSSYFEPVWEKLLGLLAQLDYFMLCHNTSAPSDKNMAEVCKQNAEIISSLIPRSDIDSLFEASSSFPSSAIVPFVTALCKVSNNEFGMRPSRIFCLQKIVEVTAFNMDRERFVWTRMWKPISQHLIEAGCFNQEIVARTALDSLRQLAGKFLDKEELHSFHYQRDFLRPFHAILRKSKSKSVRQYALRCINYTVQLYHSHLKSGWEAVFSMLESSSTIVEVNRLALTVLIDIFEKHIADIMKENLLARSIKAVLKFINIPNMTGVSATYVILGVFEALSKSDMAQNLLIPVVSALLEAIRNPRYTDFCLDTLKNNMKANLWNVVSKYLLIPLFSERNGVFLLNNGDKIIEWILPAITEESPLDSIEVIKICITSPSSKILSVSASYLNVLLNKPEYVTQASLVLKGIIESIKNIGNDQNIDYIYSMLYNLINCLTESELSEINTLLSGRPTHSINSAKLFVSTQVQLCNMKTILIDEINQHIHSLLSENEIFKSIVVNEILNLNNTDFSEIAGELSAILAPYISSNNEELREALASFFIKLSQICIPHKVSI